MSGADWQVGDLALCVCSDWMMVEDDGRDNGFRPRKGGVYRVDTVLLRCMIYLGFSEARHNCYSSGGFRKIAPLTDLQRHQFETDLHVADRLTRTRERAL